MSRFVALVPELALALTALALFAMMPGRGRRAAGLVVVVAGFVALAAALFTLGASEEFLYLAYRVDAFSQAAKAAVILGMLLAAVAGGAPARQDLAAEEAFFLVVAATGLVAAVSLVETLSLFLAVEITSAAMLVLARLGTSAAEYPGWGRLIRISVTPSALMALGLALLVGATGATNLGDIASALELGAPQPAALAGALLFLAGLLVRWGAAPFYAWLPFLFRDPSPRVALFAGTALWTGLGAVVLRLVAALSPLGSPMALFLALVSVIAIAYGALNVRPRRDLRCAMSYIMTAQVGFVVAALVTPGQSTLAAALGYTLVVAAAQATVLLVVGRAPAPSLADLRAILWRSPLLLVPLAVGLGALAGLPPTAGLISRWRVLGGAWREGWRGPAVVGALASAGLALLAILALRELLRSRAGAAPDFAEPPSPTRTAWLVAWALAILLVLFGLVPAPLDRGTELLARFVV